MMGSSKDFCLFLISSYFLRASKIFLSDFSIFSDSSLLLVPLFFSEFNGCLSCER